ncbi:hypothetical protein VTN49DRAFT_4004 [Thermomyces lanuginosus]|uniref:uncharacterized protein n=1 Tax=Thermomyces lanuginosus TaxID=5541 RepID=UPI003744197F
MEDYNKHLATLQDDMDPSKPVSVESIVNKLMDDREKMQWRISIMGKNIVFRQQLERLGKFLLWSDPLIKDALKVQQSAALAWSGVSLLLSLITRGATINESILRGFNLLCDMQIYWRIVEKTYLLSSRRQAFQDLIEPIIKLYSHIIEYQARVICHLSRAQLSRAWENMAGWNDWDGKIAEIERMDEQYRASFSLVQADEIWRLELQNMEKLQSILNEIREIPKATGKEIQKLYVSKEEKDLLQDLASDYEKWKDYNPRRVDGTCDWFFTDDRFRKWKENNFGLLWVTAGPGCGKSVLSRALIDEQLLSSNVAASTVCYFFFKDGDEQRMYAANAMSAILHQLFTQDIAGCLIKHALPSHKNYGRKLVQNFSELWRILISCANSPDVQGIVCVLDALDECHPEERQRLISRLKELYHKSRQPSDSQLKLKFLITSRPYADLEASFSKFSDTIAYVRFDGDEKAAQISQEINLVIDAKVEGIAHVFGEDDRRKIGERLKSMEHRTYLWLHLTFGIIEQRPGKYGRRSNVEALLSDLPSQVSEAYEKILERGEDELQTETLLHIILAAKRPLTLDEVNMALTIATENGRFDSHDALLSEMWPRESFKNTVKDLCGLFINVYDGKLLFIHQTARDFLIHRKRKGNWQGRFDLTRSHSKMALVCLEYLSYLDDQMTFHEIRAKSPLAEYSAKHWMSHAKQAETEGDVQESVLNFFVEQKKAFKVWGELYEPARYLAIEHGMDLPLSYASEAGLQRIAQLLLERGVDVNARGGHFGSALQAASYWANKDMVELLLDRGADVNAQGGEYGNALQAASRWGNKELAEMLLERGADVNARGGHFGYALQAASYSGHKELAELLFERGADVNAQGGEYGNALQAACYCGKKELVELLLEKGADINAQGGEYGNALQAACLSGNTELVELLLEKGADVNAQGGEYGNALQVASSWGHKQLVELLLERGADVNALGGQYGSALQAASENGHKEVARLLLERGSSLNVGEDDEYGNDLYTASYYGNKIVVELLLERGADPNAHGAKYGNALQAASYWGYIDLVKLLVESGADVNAQGGEYGNALQAASERGHKDVAQLLLDGGANVNAKGGKYGNALQAACISGNKELVDLLLKMGADVSAQGGEYGNALQTACIGRNIEVVRLLLERGANINAQGGKYGDALQAACGRGSKQLALLLLERGADVNAQGGWYGSALQAACVSKNNELVQLLLERGASVNAQGGVYGNALQAAAYVGNKDLVTLLLDKGADVSAQGGKYGNALQAASKRGRKEIVKLLMERGADANAHELDRS